MNILWSSNAPWVSSGYGEQANLFLPRIEALGHKVSVAASFGLQSARFDWNGHQVFGAPNNIGLREFYDESEADLCIILNDAWTLHPEAWPERMRVAVWAPIDHYPPPPKVISVLQHKQVRPIAMSRFGEEWMKRFKLDPLYVPHGVDTNLYRPQPDIKASVRDELNIPQDAFLVGMVAANKGWNVQVSRKCFPQAFAGFGRFAKKHPDAWLYVHAQAIAPPPGMNLDVMAQAMHHAEGLPLDRVKFPPDAIWQLGFPREQMANLYAAFDVLLNPSMGEGFGIPILEAQACGVPVIASDHSAMTEMTQAGWLVSGDPWWDSLQDSFAFMPSVQSITNALEAAYLERDNQDLKDGAREFALHYDADVVTTQFWEPALVSLSKPKEVGPLHGNRKQRRKAAQGRT